MADEDQPIRMSDAVTTAVENAVGEAMQKAGGGYVTGHISFVTFIDADGDRCWSLATAEGQTAFQTLGLLEGAKTFVEHELRKYLP